MWNPNQIIVADVVVRSRGNDQLSLAVNAARRWSEAAEGGEALENGAARAPKPQVVPPPPPEPVRRRAAPIGGGSGSALWITLRDDGDRAAGQDLLRRMGDLIQGMPGDDPVFLRIEGPSGGTLLALPEQWRTAANFAMVTVLNGLLAKQGEAELAAPLKNAAAARR